MASQVGVKSHDFRICTLTHMEGIAAGAIPAAVFITVSYNEGTMLTETQKMYLEAAELYADHVYAAARKMNDPFLIRDASIVISALRNLEQSFGLNWNLLPDVENTPIMAKKVK